MNGRQLDAIDEAYAPRLRAPLARCGDIDRVASKALAAAIHRAFPDRVAALYEQIADGDLVVTRFTSRGAEQGEFMGRAPTGAPHVTVGICISRIEDGCIAEDWEIVDHSSGPFAG